MSLIRKIARRVKLLPLLPLACITTVRVFAFVFKNRRAILKNRIIYPFYCSSFGHNIISFELLTRLTYPHKASVIYTPWQRFNPYLPKLFEDSIDLFYFHTPHSIHDYTWNVMRFALICITFGPRAPNKPVVYEYEGFCHLLSLGEKDIAGHEENNRLYEIRNTRGLYNLIRNRWGKIPQLPEAEQNQCRSAITEKYPDFFDKPFVTMLLRKKGEGSAKLSDQQRNPADMREYIPATKYWAKSGFHIAGTGETDNDIFRNIEGYYDLSDINLDQKLLNIFLITECNIFFGQQSGPYYLPNSRAIQCVLTNSMPYRMGSLGQQDLNLYKKIQIDHQDISVAALYKNHIDLVRGYHFKDKNVTIIDNTADEILETVKEAVDIFNGKETPKEIAALDQKLKSLMPDDIRAKKDPSRMPAFILKSLKDVL